MSEMQIFNNPEFGQIRAVELDGEPWFVGKDVAVVLGYKNPQEAIRTHVDEEDKGVSEILTPGGKQAVPVINESGLYSLVLLSKLPTAKKFKRWVTQEVLPSIRKNGGYIQGQEAMTPAVHRFASSTTGSFQSFRSSRLTVVACPTRGSQTAWTYAADNNPKIRKTTPASSSVRPWTLSLACPLGGL